MFREHFGIVALVLWSFASVVYACPICDSETGDAVRAGIQDNFGYNLLAAVSPFAVIALAFLFVTSGPDRISRRHHDLRKA